MRWASAEERCSRVTSDLHKHVHAPKLTTMPLGEGGIYRVIRRRRIERKWSSQMNRHCCLLGTHSLSLALSPGLQRVGNTNWIGYLVFCPWTIPFPLLCAKSHQDSLSPFKHIINILSGVSCAQFLQMASSCLVSPHAGSGMTCQTTTSFLLL